ncbi:metallophosphoesterase family protein [Candidatus Frankia nodulisporulans]|uniref:metallophosphoesterase family protein n=2 Tax=Candidatus Frankia nodulisporulans TaxID=2060052 RepID=UPI0013D08C97|nr:metallophosphoesterase [Candidatus Frankia nodulisporulans]
MRVHVVSDVHGRADALAAAGRGADAFICLGDLVLFTDYANPGGGIMGDLFGAEAVRRMVRLRTDNRFDEARAWSQSLWAGLGGDRTQIVEDAVRRQYAQLFAAFPTPTYLTFGNVDLPHLYPDFLRSGITLLDGQTVELDGWRFGFVGGGLSSLMRTPYEIDEGTFAAKVAALGAVDVLCCHIPPHLPELVYDVVAGRFERGSTAILAAIHDTRPRYVLFGHVHQPLLASIEIGGTRCVNVGHFNATGRPFVLEW